MKLIQGDCLEQLGMLQSGVADAVITDPPYMIGAASVGNRKSKHGRWADMENSAYWFGAWFQEARRVLKEDGFLAVFGNWRSIPTLIRAGDLADMTASSCLIWDKVWIGPASKNQLRPRYELCLIFPMSKKALIPDRSAPDIYECMWSAGHMGKSGHPAEKPVELLRHLVRTLSPSGGVVIDPFMGSGSTGIAALQEGRDFIGIEREPRYMEIAKGRVAQWQPSSG